MNAAFIWVVDGKRYRDEAVASALSAERHMPDVDRILVTSDGSLMHNAFTGILVAPPREHKEWYLDSVMYFGHAYRNLPYQQMLFMDTDTYFCASVMDLFELLYYFDLIGTHAPGRKTAPTVTEIPDSFPELNIGVLGIARTIAMGDFLIHWGIMYKKNRDVYEDNDQAPLREALYRNGQNIKFYVFPPEYNCRFGFGGFARYDIKILHGRSEDISAVERDINSVKGMRGWQAGKYK